MAIAGALHPVASAAVTKQVILTSGTSWTVPSDWNSANNAIHCIGPGATGAKGGGGGAYARKNNLALLPGATVSYSVGLSAGSDTWFASQTIVKAVSAVGSAGGSAGGCVGDVAFSGGNGGAAASLGGGGAAGPNGNGLNCVGSTGGAGDAGFGGAGGVGAGGNGQPGTEWGTAGSGGGSGSSGNGGLYGGGACAGSPAPGVIVITWTTA